MMGDPNKAPFKQTEAVLRKTLTVASEFDRATDGFTWNVTSPPPQTFASRKSLVNSSDSERPSQLSSRPKSAAR
jgi:hypothetical protein